MTRWNYQAHSDYDSSDSNHRLGRDDFSEEDPIEPVHSVDERIKALVYIINNERIVQKKLCWKMVGFSHRSLSWATEVPILTIAGPVMARKMHSSTFLNSKPSQGG